IVSTSDTADTSTDEPDESTDPDATTDDSGDEDPDSTSLPGEPIELYPYEGADLAVVGVDRDDVLNMRSGPGEDFDTGAELSPIETGIVATGHNRQVDDGIWAEVHHGDETGWVSVAYVMQLGRSDDITDEIDLPISGETMVDIA